MGRPTSRQTRPVSGPPPGRLMGSAKLTSPRPRLRRSPPRCHRSPHSPPPFPARSPPVLHPFPPSPPPFPALSPAPFRARFPALSPALFRARCRAPFPARFPALSPAPFRARFRAPSPAPFRAPSPVQCPALVFRLHRPVVPLVYAARALALLALVLNCNVFCPAKWGGMGY